MQPRCAVLRSAGACNAQENFVNNRGLARILLNLQNSNESRKKSALAASASELVKVVFTLCAQLISFFDFNWFVIGSHPRLL